MKKLMMLVVTGLVSFNVGATEVYSCSFNERVSHYIGGDIPESDSKYLKNVVDTVKRGETETVTYIIEGDKAFVNDSLGKVEATFLRTSFTPSDWLKNPIVHNVSFTEKIGLFPSTTIISGDFAARTTVIEEPAFKGVQVWTSYGKCIKSIL